MDDAELEARAIEVLTELQARRSGRAAPTLTVRELFERYEAHRRRSKSWPQLETRLRPFVKAFGSRDVMSLKVIDWTEHRAVRMETEIPTGKPGRRYCDHSINLELDAAKTMFNTAVQQGRIVHNPLLLAKKEKAVSRRRTAPREHEVTDLLDECNPQRRYVVLAAADAGMRRNEIRLLCHDWIDRDSMTIRLDASCTKGAKARTVQLTQRFLDAIDALPRHVRCRCVLVNRVTGKPYGSGALSRWFRGVADAAGVQAKPQDKRVHLHDVRHGFATNSARRGVRIEVIQAQLGHAKLDTTSIYVEEADVGDIGTAREAFERGILRDQERRPAKRAEAPVEPTRQNRQGE